MRTNYYAPLGSHFSAGVSFECGAVPRFVYYRRLVAPTFVMLCVGMWKVHLWLTYKSRKYSWRG